MFPYYRVLKLEPCCYIWQQRFLFLVPSRVFTKPTAHILCRNDAKAVNPKTLRIITLMTGLIKIHFWVCRLNGKRQVQNAVKNMNHIYCLIFTNMRKGNLKISYPAVHFMNFMTINFTFYPFSN